MKAELSNSVILNSLKSWLISYSVDPNPSESSTNTIANIIPLSRNNIGFFCGPEAGLTVEEEKVLKTYSAHSINLGKNILRSRDVLSFAAIFFRSLT